MPVGEPQQVPLTEYMRDKGPVWEKTVEKYGLSKDVQWEQLGTWTFAVSLPLHLAMVLLHRVVSSTMVTTGLDRQHVEM